ncbi:histidinol-phosphate transaminase [Tribonema minus]|uniref:histidinol-phosphate transaminase n=1 Tax=Tribonema minus TaxID=303371 RepID=A0A836C9P4_9STRA|nr:histidinol-phosphate transaminase [Tribonema minus]
MPRDGGAIAVTALAAVVVAAASAVVVACARPKPQQQQQRARRTLKELARQNILDLTPYRCARDDYNTGILLDANENSYGATISQSVLELDMASLELNRYPDPYQLSVKQLLAEFRGVKTEQIFVGVGSDEAIDLLIRIFCEPGKDAILTTPPTYGMYKVCAKVNDVAVQTAPLTPEFAVDEAALLRAVTPATKMVFLCSPGNPTAVSVPLDVVRRVHDAFDGIVVVDEAYVDFALAARGGGGETACALVGALERVVVLQTLSKAFGMAAIRVGMAYAHADVVQLMNNVKAPYNVNRLSEEVARTALSNLSLYRQRVAQLLEQRDKLMETLRNEPYVRRVLPSDANFFLVEIEHAHTIYLHMAENGVVVRFRGNELHCTDCLRITVGTAEENAKLLELLRATVKGVQDGTIALRE